MSARTLSTPASPPPVGDHSSLFSFDDLDDDELTAVWTSLRDSGITPQHQSELGGSPSSRRRFLTGARLMGLMRPGRLGATPQQLRLSDMLAAGRRDNGVLKPRRSAKSTGLIADSLGIAADPATDDWRCAILTATTGKAGRSRFLKDVVPALERNHDGRLKVHRAAGQERVEWPDTGSTVAWMSSVEDMRGEAFDRVIIDEAGEPDAAKVDDINGAALPTLDTRPHGQYIAAGTAGDYRKGNLLWDTLESGRAGLAGILEYAFPDGTTVDDIATWEQALPLVLASHPGIGNLTTLDAVRTNFERFKRQRFLREYGNVFGDTGNTTGLFKPDAWNRLELGGEFPPPPAHFGLAIAVTPGQDSAAIGAAWREDGQARLLLLDRRDGVQWLVPAVLELAGRTRATIVHDTFGPILAETEALNRAVPRPKLAPQTMKNVQTAAALLAREIETGNLGHWGQDELTGAILRTVRRKIGVNGWGLGRPDLDADITPAEACAMALRWYDENPQRERLGIVT
jgi:hypothetical protein